jgi:hypothetical protein
VGDTDTVGSSPNSKDTDIGIPTALWFLHWHLQGGLDLNGCSCGFDSEGDTRVRRRWAEYEYETPKYEYDESRFRGSSVAENLQPHFTLSLTSLHPFFNITSHLLQLNFLPAFKGLKVQIVTMDSYTYVKGFARNFSVSNE